MCPCVVGCQPFPRNSNASLLPLDAYPAHHGHARRVDRTYGPSRALLDAGPREPRPSSCARGFDARSVAPTSSLPFSIHASVQRSHQYKYRQKISLCVRPDADTERAGSSGRFTMYSDDSSDDEFFDPEEDIRSETAPPSPSWLTRQQSIGAVSTRGDEVGGAGEAHAEDPSASTSPSAASGGALDLSQLAETMPSVTGDEGPPPESDTPGAAASDAPVRDPRLNPWFNPRASPPRVPRPNSTSTRVPRPPPSGSPPARRPRTTTHHPHHRHPPTEGPPPRSHSRSRRCFASKIWTPARNFSSTKQRRIECSTPTRTQARRTPRAPASNPRAAPASTVKDLQTGRDISVEDFERSVGLSPLMREVNARERAAVGASVDNDGVGVGVGNNGTGTSTSTHDDARAQKKKKPFGRNPGRWLTKRLGEAQSYVNKSSASKAPRDSARGSGGAGPGHSGERGDEDAARTWAWMPMRPARARRRPGARAWARRSRCW